jgi:Carboxypeptidase regulatory-like domain
MKQFKKQDIPVVARIVLEAFIRNKSDFINFSTIFDGSFEVDMDTAIKAIQDRRRPADAFDKQRMVTKGLYVAVSEMQELLRMVGEYVRIAEENLQTEYEFYHIMEARKELHAKNVEGIIEHCEQIIDKVTTEDSVALDAVGFDAGKLSEFEDKLTEIRELNREQIHLMNERQDLKENENVLFETMYKFMDNVTNVGKAMYTYKSKQKYSDFSVSHILGQINHGRKKTAENSEEEEGSPIYDVMTGRVTDKLTDDSLADVVVRIEGSDIMVDTDEDGEFYIDEIPAGVYTVSFAKRGYVKSEQHNIEIGTSNMVTLNVELLAEDKESKGVAS